MRLKKATLKQIIPLTDHWWVDPPSPSWGEWEAHRVPALAFTEERLSDGSMFLQEHFLTPDYCLDGGPGLDAPQRGYIVVAESEAAAIEAGKALAARRNETWPRPYEIQETKKQ